MMSGILCFLFMSFIIGVGMFVDRVLSNDQMSTNDGKIWFKTSSPQIFSFRSEKTQKVGNENYHHHYHHYQNSPTISSFDLQRPLIHRQPKLELYESLFQQQYGVGFNDFRRIIYSVDYQINLIYCADDYPFPGKYHPIEPTTRSPTSGLRASFQMNVLQSALALMTIDAAPIRWKALANGTIEQPCYLANIHEIATNGILSLINQMYQMASPSSTLSEAEKKIFYLTNVVNLVWFEKYPQNPTSRPAVQYVDVLRRFAIMDTALSMGMIVGFFRLMDECDRYVSKDDLIITGLPFVHYQNVTIGVPPSQTTIKDIKNIIQNSKNNTLILQRMDEFRQALVNYYLSTHP